MFLDPPRAIQLVIIISTVLSVVVLRGLLPVIAPWLLLRLALGSLVGLPLGLVAFRYADPVLVRAAAGAIIFGFAILMAVSRRRSGQPGQGTSRWLGPTLLAPRPSPLPPPSDVVRAAHPERAQPAPAQVINQLLDEDRSSGITTLIMTVFDTEAWGRLSGVDIGPRQPAAYTTVLDRFQCPSGSRRALIKAPGNASFPPH